jgi:hypothetical protein
MTIEAMRPELTKLGAGLLRALDAFKQDDPFLDLGLVRIEETKWTKEGKLILSFSTLGLLNDIRPDRYYIDNLVADLIERDQHMNPCSGELAQFISAMVDQFGFIKKNNVALDLGQLSFQEMRWIDQHLVFNIQYRGEPYTPKEARW